MTHKRLLGALACFGFLAGLAGWTLDGRLRLVVWIFLGGLALKSYLAFLRAKLE